MQAIILCGGQGTRLRSVIGEKQKTMTEVGNTPFLVDVINYLKSYKITNIIFATGYKSNEVRDYFGDKYFYGVEVNYSEELEPLGTGGAIRNALPKVKSNYVYVLNGDTLFKTDLNKLKDNFLSLDADMSIACKESTDNKRYGTVKLDLAVEKSGSGKGEMRVLSFDEKVDTTIEEGGNKDLYINGGVYILKKRLIETIEPGVSLSLEKELIPRWLREGKIIGGIVSDDSFIDIGTPESLERYKMLKGNQVVNE